MAGESGQESGILSTPIRRVLVALDASPASLAALEAATELAALFEAELLGLFVEDERLLRLPDLPFAREVSVFSGAVRPLERRQLELELRALAGRARAALAERAGRRRVRWSFQVLRGGVAPCLLEAVSAEDLVSVGVLGWSLTQKMRVGTTARAVLSARRGSALLLRRDAAPGAPVRVVFDGSPAAGKALGVAARLARARRVPLRLLATEAAGSLPAAGREDDVEIRAVRVPAGESLLEALDAAGGGPVVLPGDGPLSSEELLELAARLDAPLLLIR